MKNMVRHIRNGGRPKKEGWDKKGKVISFRVDEITWQAIERELESSRLFMGEFIRRAVKNAKISPADYNELIGQIDSFSAEQLINLIVVQARVVAPLSKEQLDDIKGLYRVATDINYLVKKGNALLKGKSGQELIDFKKELIHIGDEFKKVKDLILKNYEEEQQ